MTTGWQVRRSKGRRIYTGLSRTQVEHALRSGKLKSDDLALPPGETRWMAVAVALVHTGEEAAPGAGEVSVPDWAPMEKEGRLIEPELEEEDPAEMDMTPMIDVTTLLLIFFLVGGTFLLQASVALPEAKTGTPDLPSEAEPVGIMIKLDPKESAGGTVVFEDAASQPVALENLVAGYKERVARRRDNGQSVFLNEATIRAHRDVPFGIVRQTMAKLTEAGAANIHVAVEEARGVSVSTSVEEAP